MKSMVTTSSSEESEETEEKYSQLVDLLTVKMFNSDKYEQKTQTKSNSLPRSFEPETQSSLQKSNSQVWLSNVFIFFFV